MFKIKKLSAIIAGAFILMPLSGVVWSADDLPGDATTVREVKVGSFETGAFEMPQDVDWMRVRLEAHVTYKIKMTSDKLPEVTLKIANANHLNHIESQVTQRDLMSMEAAIIYTPENSGDYFVMASTDNSSTGYYIISVEELARPILIEPPSAYYPLVFPPSRYPGRRDEGHMRRDRRTSPPSLPNPVPEPSKPVPPVRNPIVAPVVIPEPTPSSRQISQEEELRQKSEREHQQAQPPAVEPVFVEPTPMIAPQVNSREEELRLKSEQEHQQAQPPAVEPAAVEPVFVEPTPVPAPQANSREEEQRQRSESEHQQAQPPAAESPRIVDPVPSESAAPPPPAPEPSPPPPAPAPSPKAADDKPEGSPP